MPPAPLAGGRKLYKEILMKIAYYISRSDLKAKATAAKTGSKFKSVRANHEVWALVIALLQKAEIK